MPSAPPQNWAARPRSVVWQSMMKPASLLLCICAPSESLAADAQPVEERDRIFAAFQYLDQCRADHDAVDAVREALDLVAIADAESGADRDARERPDPAQIVEHLVGHRHAPAGRAGHGHG